MKSKFYLIALFASLIVASCTAVQAQKKANSKKEIAIQLYSVRDIIGNYSNPTEKYNADFTAILKKLARMGYTGVEAAGYNDGKFYGKYPEEFKREVEDAGLQVLSSHCTKSLTEEEYVSGDFTESLKWWDKCIAAHKAAGMTYIVTPGTGVPKTVKDLKTYCDYSNEIGKRCKQNGLLYGYHNHAHEFQKVENKVVMMDYMIENTNPEYVFIEMDVYWIIIGKNSPVDYFNKYPGRFKALHIKDHREIGQSGMVGFDAIFNNAKTAGVKHIIVEMEQSSTTIEEGLKTSIDYLLKAPFVKTSYNIYANKDLLNSKRWTVTGNVAMQDGLLSLTGEQAQVLLKNGDYKDFDLSMELRTNSGGKGFIGFHTDSKGKGYRVAINNDREDAVWWRMTGSLVSVRNLAKSFVKENEWFTMNIRVEGKAVTVKINGEPVVEYIEPSKPFRTGINANALLSHGSLSITSAGAGSLQFRNITIEALDGKNINTSVQLEMANDEQSDEIIRLHQEDFPVLDYHVHLKGGLTKEAAAIQSRKTGINYAVAPNCGIGFPVTSDEDIYKYLDAMRTQPFILAMQAEGREWITTFSQKARDEFDYVFTDAMTFKDHKDRRVHLWVNKEVIIDDEQEYMDMIVDRICAVLQEPVDVYVNPFFLPESMSDRYDNFWTEKRMNKVVEALAASGKALEINELYHIPNKAIIMKAKAAGVKFTFGSNNVTPEVGKLEYSIRMKNECGLTPQNMYKPKIKI